MDISEIPKLDITVWLRGLGLERYAGAFAEHAIDAEVLPQLTEADLEKLGVLLGHRKKLLKAIGELVDGGVGLAPLAPVTPSVAPTAASREAERRHLTVLFCDLVGSTALSGQLDPEAMRNVITRYQNAVASEVARFEGHIAKFMGDGVLAYFGWPMAHEDDAERAVRAGLALAAAVGRLTTPAGQALAARIGIATGLVVVGDLIGEGAAQEEAVVGETPNLAARLQAVAEPGSVVIGPATRRLVGGLFELTDLGRRRLKGFSDPLAAWRVDGEGGAEGRFEALHGERLTPLVGREHELGILLERWTWAKDGDGQVVLLSGEPGIGKSRVIRSLIGRLADEPHTRLRYYCSPYHTNSALYPVTEQLERAAGFRVEDSAETRLDKLEAALAEATDNPAEVAPIVAALLSIPAGRRYPPLNLTAEAQKLRTFEVLLAQVVGLAERRTLLMVLEDAQWIDPTSIELFGLIIDRIQHLPVLLLTAFRPGFTTPWTGYAHVTSLTLSRLGQRQGAQIVERLTGGKPLPCEVLRQILLKTDGVPLFVEELTKTVLESGLLADAGDHYELSGPLPPLAIPATLHDSLMARLDRLVPVKEVAQIGAVIGREFSHELLAAVAPMSGNLLGDALEQLVNAELVFRRGTPPEATYSFKHALVQDTAYESLLKSRRQQLHTRIAEALEQSFVETAQAQPDLLAHHCTEAGLTEKAVAYWHKAGQQALARSAMTEAVSHLTRGLELLERLPEGPERQRHELDLQLALGSVLMATKGFTAVETDRAYARAHELCSQTGTTPQLFPALFGRFVVHIQRAELNAAYEVARELLRLAEEQCDVAAQVTACRAAGAVLFQLGDLVESRANLERGVALYDAQRDRTTGSTYGIDSRVVSLHWLSQALLTLGYPDQARARVGDALTCAGELAHPSSTAHALCGACFTYQRLRRRVEAQAEAELLVTLAKEHGFPLWGAAGVVIRGWALVDAGRTDEGLEEIRRGIAQYLATGAELWLADFLALHAEAQGRAGHAAAGLSLLGDALDRVARGGRRWLEPELHRLKGELLLALPKADSAEAEARFREAIAGARERDARMLELRAATSLAGLWRDQGERQKVRDLLAPIYGWFTEGFETADLKDAKALLDELA
jgi:class 3 adenylate cyclase/predicted ATPase